MNTNRQWLLAKRPFGEVGKENFEYAETPSRAWGRRGARKKFVFVF